MPPETPSSTRRPTSTSRGLAVTVDSSPPRRARVVVGAPPEPGLLLLGLLGPLVVDLALGDLLAGDRERLVAEARLDERGGELPVALAGAGVGGVDAGRRCAGAAQQVGL